MVGDKKIKNLVFMGPPGVGKGTVASIIAQEYGLVHLSTGNIFRAEIASASELGKKVSSIVESGGYVPDDITNEIVARALENYNKSGKIVILDGYPRTLSQVEFLDSLPYFKYEVIELRAKWRVDTKKAYQDVVFVQIVKQVFILILCLLLREIFAINVEPH
nr:nucleoside monophosphate kinase [Mycoplasmopsis bovis]